MVKCIGWFFNCIPTSIYKLNFKQANLSAIQVYFGVD